MPELPEVETIRRSLEPFVINKAIHKVIIRQPQLRWLIPNSFTDTVQNQTIKSLARRGKYILFNCSGGTIIMHFGMSGNIRIVDESQPLLKHDHVDLYITSHKILRYHDPRRFGSILWTEQDPYQHPLLKFIGQEPLDPNFNASYLYERAKNAHTNIKSFIMNSRMIAGIGNIYACEALFHAHIHPMKKASSLSIQQWENLANAISRVLKQSLEAGGTTLKDYVNGHGEPGYFAQMLWVYGRNEENCRSCANIIQSMTISQRTTFYCEKCQSM